MGEPITPDSLRRLRDRTNQIRRECEQKIRDANAGFRAAITAYVIADLRDKKDEYGDPIIDNIDEAEFYAGSWECNDSPVGVCVYEQWAGEDCVYCGAPSERK